MTIDLNDTPIDSDEPFDLEQEPLERPPFPERDWGGDGSDLGRPVRAHVLAALRPSTGPYSPPVDGLLRLGDPREGEKGTERYKEVPLGQEDLPELLRMVRDRELYIAKDDTLEVWAPVHALAAIGDLQLSAADVAELIPLFDLDDDWYQNELPTILGNVGEQALGPLGEYLADNTRWGYGHAFAADALEKIAKQHPNLRPQVVALLEGMLREAEGYHEISMTEVMGRLVDLQSVESLPLIRRAFELEMIDEEIHGPWGMVLDRLGLEPEADDPLVAQSQQRFEQRRKRLNETMAGLERWREAREREAATKKARQTVEARAREKARKEKNKRKAASAARKANRKKRK